MVDFPVTMLKTLFFFIFTPARQALSVGRWLQPYDRRGETNRDERYPPWAQRMMQIQVTVLYLVTGFAKLSNELWREGVAGYYIFGLVDFNVRGVEQLMNYPVIYSATTYGALLAEFLVPILLWFRTTRLVAVAIGLGLHGWIVCFMTIPLFGPLMICSYLLFLSEGECEKLSRFGRRAFSRVRASNQMA
jgi:hypothetical protein